MCRAKLISGLFAFVVVHVQAQSWGPADIPGQLIYNLQRVQASADHSAIYYCGSVRLDSIQWYHNNPVLRYSDGQWDTLGKFNNIIFTTIEYHDTLIAGGGFQKVDGDSVGRIAFYSGGTWHPYGEFNGTVRRLRVLDGELYAAGPFSEVDGQFCNGVAKRVGGHWEPLGIPTGSGLISDVCKAFGNIFIVGGISVIGTNGILQFDGSSWSAVGPGIQGAFSGGMCMANYQGQLYIGGQIHTSEGNAGQNIMRWDGTQFQSVGDGIWWQYGTQSTATVTSMVEHDGLLYVGGGFHYASQMPVDGLVTWDGTEWCRVPGALTSEGDGILSMDFCNDTLFVSTIGDTLDGAYTKRAAKFIGATYADTCSTPVGLAENLSNDSPGLNAWSDAYGTIHISGISSSLSEVALLDATGRLVMEMSIQPDQHGRASFQALVSHGLYLIRSATDCVTFVVP